jgi:integration host factor subunit alpha
MALTKEHIVQSIGSHCDLPERQSRQVFESVLEMIKGTLESGEDILVSGFGKLCVKDKSERRGRNPQTGEDLKLVSRRVITFKCSPVLREKINGDRV